MAYTGILFRGDTFTNIYGDQPIAREAVTAGEHLGFGTNSGTVYWINLAALSTIGAIIDGSGGTYAGIKTSALPISYDGTGYLKEEVDHLLVGDTYLFRYAALDALEVLSDTNFTFGSFDISTPNLDFMTTYKPVMSALTVNDVVVTFTKGVKAMVYNETTRTELGIVTSSGATLTFGGAQTVTDVITAVALDADYNHSAKHMLAIA